MVRYNSTIEIKTEIYIIIVIKFKHYGTVLIQIQTAEQSQGYVRVLEITRGHCQVSKYGTASTLISGHPGQL